MLLFSHSNIEDAMLRLTRLKIHSWKNSILLAVVVLFAALQFSGCQMTSADGGPPPPPAPATATFLFCDKEAPSCDNETSFSATSTRDLEVKVSWQNVPAGSHVQTLEILLPGGNLYQQTQMAFGVEQGSSEPLVAIQTLPVAGTWIQQRHMMGEWTARVSLDGQVVASQTVELTP
jgi:hypothetical protein